MCNGAAKQVSAGVAPCNMVGFVKLFRTSVARQVSRKVEPLSTSATARNGRSGEKKQEFHRLTPRRETGLVCRCTQVSAKSFNAYRRLNFSESWMKTRTLKESGFHKTTCNQHSNIQFIKVSGPSCSKPD